MPKKRSEMPTNYSLFELAAPTPSETLAKLEADSSPLSATENDPTSCPKCGAKSLLSVRPLESGGTRYCVVCAVDGEPYYFTPSEPQR